MLYIQILNLKYGFRHHCKQMIFNAIIFKTCFHNVHCDSDNNKLSLYSNNWFFHCIRASADNYLLQYMCLFSPPLVGGCELSMIHVTSISFNYYLYVDLQTILWKITLLQYGKNKESSYVFVWKYCSYTVITNEIQFYD